MLWPSHVTATVVACDLPCTSASVIFRTSSHSDFTLCFFDLSIKILALLLWTTLTICLSPWAALVALQSSHCHLVSTSLPAVGTALLTALPAVGTALSSRILGFRPWLFFFVLHVRLIRVLLLTSWLTHALSLFLPSPAAIGLTVSRSKHALQTSSFVPILGFGSRVSLALVCFFSPDCDFLFVIVLVASLSCATSRLVCSSSSILW